MKELKINLTEEDFKQLQKLYNTDDNNKAVEMALNEILKEQVYKRILSLGGSIAWEGNIEEMRGTRI